jgi:Rieske 2Fe-2S family protein
MTFVRTAESYRQGARTMPGEFYTSPAILAEEQERIFARAWHCAGRTSTLARPGDYLLREIAGESIILVRDKAGVLRAHFNVCRHRGTRLCQESSGHVETIQCPYHAWTYATDGRLIGAPHMQLVDGFDRDDYPLHSAAVAEHEGFAFVNIDRTLRPCAEVFAPMFERFSRFSLGRLSVGHRVTYDVKANWKLVFQNYSECLHCPVIHPELAAVLPYQSGENDLVDGPFLGGSMEITPPHESATLSGRACGPLLPGGVRGHAYYYSLMPNMLISIHPDYVNYYLITPVAVNRTRVESEWLFPETSDAPANREDAIAFWDVTNRQDWDIVSRSQLGIQSRRYEPGPYSPRESIPAAWDREYLKMMGRS